MDKKLLDYIKAGEDIAKLYEAAELAVLEDITARINMGDEISPESWRRQLEAAAKAVKENAKELYTDITAEAAGQATEILAGAYQEGYASGPSWEQLGKVLPESMPKDVLRLIAETTLAFGHIKEPVLRRVNDVYRDLQGETIKKAMSSGMTRVQATQDMLSKFADRGLTGFVDKAGRQWDAASYAEMCMRTNAMKAYRQGFLDEEVAAGNNLVYVSRHLGACELCRPWELKILRIRGI